MALTIASVNAAYIQGEDGSENDGLPSAGHEDLASTMDDLPIAGYTW